jgi:hypothetical protein
MILTSLLTGKGKSNSTLFSPSRLIIFISEHTHQGKKIIKDSPSFPIYRFYSSFPDENILGEYENG